MYTEILAIFLITWILWKLYVRSVERSFMIINNGKSLPGPNPSFLGLVELWTYMKGSYHGLLKKYGHYGPVIRVFVGPFVWVLPTVLDHSYQLYTKKSFGGGILRKAFGDFLPGSITVTDGTEWKRHRLAISPFFATENVEGFCSDILDIAKEEYDDLETDKSFHLLTWTNMIIARILMKSLFNVTVDKKNAEELKRFDDAAHVMGNWVAGVLLCFIICPPLARTQFMKNFINKKTAPLKKILQKMKDNPNPDCLWQQLEQNGKFTWEEFENESIALLAVGLETSSFSLGWILHSLSKNPEVKSKLKREIDDVLGGRSPTPKDLDNLPYLENFLLESFRYHALVLTNGRNALEQDSIGEYQIPKGTHVFECPNYTVRNAVENPDRFDPDRYNEGNSKELSKIAMTTFGMGPRACIGRHLAILELKLITVFLLQQKGDIEVDITKDQFNPHLSSKAPTYLTAIKKSHVKKIE